MSEALKFCKACKHAKVGLLDRLFGRYRFALCEVSPPIQSDDLGYLVTGRRAYDEQRYCSIARKFGPCGENASLFEPKAS